MPTRPPSPDLVTRPSEQDPVVHAASEVVGGPIGRYAAPLVHGVRQTAALLAAAAALPMGLAVVERAHCLGSGWSTPDQFWHLCFSDLPATYKDSGLSVGLGPFLTGGSGAPSVGQPPLTALVMSGLAQLVPDGTSAQRMLWYFGLWAALAAVLIAVSVWWTAMSVPRFPLRAAHLALSPVVVLTVVVAPDVLGVALVAGGLWAWGRSRLVLAGVLLGLAVSARTYPVLILLAMLLVSLRAGRLRPWLQSAGAVLATVVVVVGGLLVLNPAAALAAYRGWAGAGAGFGSLWVLPQLAGYPLPPGAVTTFAVLGWVAALVTGALLALAAPRRPTVAEVSLVMVTIVLVTGKSVPVQSSLWLVPLVALVGLAWRDHLVWAGAETLHFVAVWLYVAAISVPDRGLPAGWYAFFLGLRLTGMLWLVNRTWRISRSRWPDLREEADGLRRSAEQQGSSLDPGLLAALQAADEQSALQLEPDELAGPLRGARDQLIVRVG
ncbi:hypothetical protein V3N99_11285 [Dermatophilaceae bacterium Soc4.6]